MEVEFEFEVEPCLELKYCVVCWWYAKVEQRHKHPNYADILLNGVPVCEEHLSMLLRELYRPNWVIYDFFRKKARELGREMKIECKTSSQRWNLRARLKVTIKEETE